ncbi:peptidoglycan editing factor PgeF [Pseudomonas stutzeri]|uniref:peptidoglycan editing factor PgeF n=1 Tax=Stutzerimonas stutzeri TaxID=316 RepID=UPI00210CA0EA|nr:peptidoglycan editing factor PgeF [Stutzerimonas stutzeri]
MNRWPDDWITPDWPAPLHVRACVTTRNEGLSQPPFDSFNLGDHVGDDPAAVMANRQRLRNLLGCEPAWLSQVHSATTVKADPALVPTADASWTDATGIACTVLTADCLPVLFCNRAGTRVAAAHAGWRGLASGMLESTVAAMQSPGEQLLVWLGPAIGPDAFEVGPEVREAFIEQHAVAAEAFRPSHNAGRYMADLYHLARIHLAACGVTAVFGGELCTFSDPRFYSYRRTARTGRFASLIWIDKSSGKLQASSCKP